MEKTVPWRAAARSGGIPVASRNARSAQYLCAVHGEGLGAARRVVGDRNVAAPCLAALASPHCHLVKRSRENRRGGNVAATPRRNMYPRRLVARCLRHHLVGVSTCGGNAARNMLRRGRRSHARPTTPIPNGIAPAKLNGSGATPWAGMLPGLRPSDAALGFICDSSLTPPMPRLIPRSAGPCVRRRVGTFYRARPRCRTAPCRGRRVRGGRRC